MKEQIEEALESEKIACALADMAEWIGDSLLEEDQTEPPYVLAAKRDRRYARFICRDRHLQNPRYRRFRKGIWIAVILLAVLTAVYASAIQAAISNYFIERKRVSMDFSESVNPENHTWYASASMPSFLPEGYRYEKSNLEENVVSFLYTKPGMPNIRYVIFRDPTAARLNSEDAGDIAELTVNGMQGRRITRKGEAQLFWGKDPAFLIEGPSSLSGDLLRMAESIVIPPKNGLE